MLILVAGLILLLGTHSVAMVSRPWRDRQMVALGEGPWKGIYSLVSLAGLVLIVWGFGLARQEAPILYEPPVGLRHLVALLMLFALIALAVAILPGGKLKRALKHPLLLAVKIWAFSHLLINGDLASLLLFGAFLAWAVLARISLKRRGAPIAEAGPILWDVVALALGILLYLLFVWKLHLWFFGVVPFG